MNEAEWLTCEQAWKMLRWLRAAICPRKFRLFVCAYCRSLWDEMTPEGARRAVDTLEGFADGLARLHELEQARKVVELELSELSFLETFGGWGTSLARQTTALRYAADSAFRPTVYPDSWANWGPNNAFQCRLIRDVFGNPFRSAAVRPEWTAWNGGLILRMAEGIYAERAFNDLPYLGDALQDAGCTDDEMLGHCRANGPHVRGCWLVDLLLGKGSGPAFPPELLSGRP
jgi:hypothetical protein